MKIIHFPDETGRLRFGMSTENSRAWLLLASPFESGTGILAGTPYGVGMAAKPLRWLKAGNGVAEEIDGIGRLVNPVAHAKV